MVDVGRLTRFIMEMGNWVIQGSSKDTGDQEQSEPPERYSVRDIGSGFYWEIKETH